jgi:hypothetical protein
MINIECKNYVYSKLNMKHIFKDIPNLDVIVSGIFPAPHTTFFTIINENTVAINLWIAALAANYSITGFKLDDIECNIHNYTIAL